MTQTARVIRANPDRTVLVEIPGDGAQDAPVQLLAANPDDAGPGEIVELSALPVRLLISVLLFYVLPLSAFIIGYVLGGRALWGAAAVVPVGVAAFLYKRRVGGGGFLIATARKRKS